MSDSPPKLPVSKIIESSILSVASSFPIASSIGTAWSEYKGHQQQKRSEEFMQDLVKRMEDASLSQTQVSGKIEELSDAAEILERCIESCIRETDRTKRQIYSEIYFNFLNRSAGRTEEERLNIIYQVEQLTIIDLNLLAKFVGSRFPISGDQLTNSIEGVAPMAQPYAVSKGSDSPISHERNFQIKHASVMQSITKLVSRGLIRITDRKTIFKTNSPSESPANRFREQAWVATYSGLFLVEAIHPPSRNG